MRIVQEGINVQKEGKVGQGAEWWGVAGEWASGAVEKGVLQGRARKAFQPAARRECE